MTPTSLKEEDQQACGGSAIIGIVGATVSPWLGFPFLTFAVGRGIAELLFRRKEPNKTITNAQITKGMLIAAIITLPTSYAINAGVSQIAMGAIAQGELRKLSWEEGTEFFVKGSKFKIRKTENFEKTEDIKSKKRGDVYKKRQVPYHRVKVEGSFPYTTFFKTYKLPIEITAERQGLHSPKPQ